MAAVVTFDQFVEDIHAEDVDKMDLGKQVKYLFVSKCGEIVATVVFADGSKMYFNIELCAGYVKFHNMYISFELVM